MPVSAPLRHALIAVAAITGIMSVVTSAQPRQMGGIGLTLFEDPDFRGESRTLRDDVTNFQFIGLNDRVSSLRVGRGELWEVCEHANFGGRCQVVSGVEPDLRRNRWNDIISSARRVRDSGRGRGRGWGPDSSLELYSNVRFSGERRSFHDEVSNLQFADFNDRARSLRVVGPGSWQICVDANFQNCVTVNRDVPDLDRMGMTRRISSLRRLGGPR
jgi:hypothetical protein